MLRTSYHNYRHKDYDENFYICISRIVLDFVTADFYCDTLAPPFRLLNKFKKDRDEKYYIEEYNKYLDDIDLEFILKLLFEKTNKNIVFTCYEISTDFCHRHILAERIESLGMKISEIGYEKYNRKNGRIVINSIF